MGALGDVKDLRVGTRLRSLLTEAGLVEVDATMIPLPLSGWSNGTMECSRETKEPCA